MFNLKRNIAEGGKAWEKYKSIVDNLTLPLQEVENGTLICFGVLLRQRTNSRINSLEI